MSNVIDMIEEVYRQFLTNQVESNMTVFMIMSCMIKQYCSNERSSSIHMSQGNLFAIFIQPNDQNDSVAIGP